MKFTAYGDQSDHGKYRIPPRRPSRAARAADGDRHVVVYDKGRCKLYELYRAFAKESDAGRRTPA